MIPSAAEPQLNRPLVPLIVLVLELVLVIEFWAEQTRPPQPFVDRFAVSTQALPVRGRVRGRYEYDYRNRLRDGDHLRERGLSYRSANLTALAA